MFKKILIANRGEIACRVIKTARRMGIATVAVYSEADRDALPRRAGRRGGLHRPGAEPRVVPRRWTGSSPPAGDRAPRRCTLATASCPRTPRFARRVEEEGIVFIGPKHASIAAMGDKIESKKLAAKAKVNTIPGYNARDRHRRARGRDRPGHRLPGDDQGFGRRRRQGPARRLERQPRPRGLHVVPQRGARRASATTASSSRSSSRSRATSRSRCSAMRTGTASTCGSASARSSAATRR